MKSFVQAGEVFTYTNSTGNDIASGDVVTSGKLIGIAATDIPDGESGAVNTCGVYQLTKKASLAISQGDVVFWDASPGEVTKTAADGVPLGVAFEDAGSSDSTVLVLLPEGSNKTAANVAALGQTISGTYTQAEVQAISTKVDAVLTALKNAGLMATA